MPISQDYNSFHQQLASMHDDQLMTKIRPSQQNSGSSSISHNNNAVALHPAASHQITAETATTEQHQQQQDANVPEHEDVVALPTADEHRYHRNFLSDAPTHQHAEPYSHYHHHQAAPYHRRATTAPFSFPGWSTKWHTLFNAMSAPEVASMLQVPENCFLCRSSYHWYTRCPAYEGTVLFFFNEMDQRLSSMQHGSWLHGAQMLDVIYFIRGTTSLAPHQYQLVVNNAVVPHMDPSVRCCEMGVLPGMLVMIILTPTARARLSLITQHVHGGQNREPPFHAAAAAAAANFAPPLPHHKMMMRHQPSNNSILEPAQPPHRQLRYQHLSVPVAAASADQEEGGAPTFQDILYAAAGEEHLSGFSYHGPHLQHQYPRRFYPQNCCNINDTVAAASDVHHYGEDRCDAYESEDVYEVVGDHNVETSRDDDAANNNNMANTSCDSATVLSKCQQRRHPQHHQHKQCDAGFSERKLVDQKKLLDSENCNLSAVSCIENSDGGLHDVSHISVASTSLLQSIPAANVTTTSTTAVLHPKATIADHSQQEGCEERPLVAANVVDVEGTAEPEVADCDVSTSLASTTSLVDVKAWADLSVASQLGASDNQHDHKDGEKHAPIPPSTSSAPNSTVWCEFSALELIKKSCRNAATTTSSDNASTIANLLSTPKDKRVGSSSSKTVNVGAMNKKMLRDFESRTSSRRTEKEMSRVKRTVHFKFIPSTMPFPHVRKMFDAAGEIRKVRIVDPSSSVPLEDRFMLAFVEYATVEGAEGAVWLHDGKKIGKFRLSVTSSKNEITGGHTTDASDDGLVKCTFGVPSNAGDDSTTPSRSSGPDKRFPRGKAPVTGTARHKKEEERKGDDSGAYRLTPKTSSSDCRSTPKNHHNDDSTLTTRAASDAAKTPQTDAKIVTAKELLNKLKDSSPSLEKTRSVLTLLFAAPTPSKSTASPPELQMSSAKPEAAAPQTAPIPVQSAAPAAAATVVSPFMVIGAAKPPLSVVGNAQAFASLPGFALFTETVTEFVRTGVEATYYNAVRLAERLCRESLVVASRDQEEGEPLLLDTLLLKCAVHARFATAASFSEAAAIATTEMLPAAMKALSGGGPRFQKTRLLLSTSDVVAAPYREHHRRLLRVVTPLLAAVGLLQHNCVNAAATVLTSVRDLVLHMRPAKKLCAPGPNNINNAPHSMLEAHMERIFLLLCNKRTSAWSGQHLFPDAFTAVASSGEKDGDEDHNSNKAKTDLALSHTEVDVARCVDFLAVCLLLQQPIAALSVLGA
ncbi:Hypothetical protein, putative [Bodo saltans]|uniref:RRM domain-containing protein n=1 Tax=Bodo saltans TaxID=75058 RepID=A0A0S4IYM7_BODSA|nr:Hypothetical protein, putative [Bodo saltans]|eukprot:CUG13691.1 Hypothetical protein, putative [Bodo saltans]